LPSPPGRHGLRVEKLAKRSGIDERLCFVKEGIPFLLVWDGERGPLPEDAAIRGGGQSFSAGDKLFNPGDRQL